MEETVEQKTDLFSLLGIPPEREAFLKEKVRDTYVEIMIKGTGDKKPSTIDVMWKVREVCTNASEDMCVCYLVGAVHGSLLIIRKQNSGELGCAILLSDIMRNMFK